MKKETYNHKHNEVHSHQHAHGRSHNHEHEHEHEHHHEHGHSHNYDHEEGHCRGHHHHHHHTDGEHKKHGLTGFVDTYAREIASAVLLITFVILSHYGVLAQTAASLNLPLSAVEAIAFAIALLPVGIPILKETVEMWLHGSFMNEFTLMVGAAVGAFIIGEYPEGVAVLLFYSFGEKMEDTASDDVRRRIRKLLGRLPDTATVKDGRGERSVNPKEVQPGSVIIVKPGERVPLDSVLLGSESREFDTSAITGESVPRSFRPGEELSSGIIPVDTAIEARAVRAFSDSSMSRIMRMIETAQASKSPTENMLRRITRWYTPTVFILALLMFAVPWLALSVFGAGDFEWQTWLRRSLVFLVCSCPCALVVSIPLTYFASLGIASNKGLLFKGSKYVDTMRDIDAIFFDKTGTITNGEFHVSSINTAAGVSSDEAVALAAGVDRESTHPLAAAIVAEAERRQLTPAAVTDVKTIPHGMTATLDGDRIVVGSAKLMKKEGVEIPVSDSDATEIFVARAGHYIATIHLLDNIKPEAVEAIRQLHSQGVREIVILSGDRPEAVERVAKAVGADSWHAALLPADKQHVISESRRDGLRVAFVGDGINDAPAIAASDLGIAMGNLGTDIAMESSDMVIAGDNLDKIPYAVRLARRVRRTVIENVSFALGVKALVMILGAFGVATLWAAVFADTGVTLITVLWALYRVRV